MTQTREKKLKNIITDDPFSMLSDTQWRYVTAMLDNPEFSKADGARAVGLVPRSIYNWPDYVDDAIELAREDMHRAALTVRKQSLLKAMRVKLALLDSDNESVRNRAATDILEWELGKAAQPLGTKDTDGVTKVIVEYVERPNDNA
jgi:hypothetical protein